MREDTVIFALFLLAILFTSFAAFLAVYRIVQLNSFSTQQAESQGSSTIFLVGTAGITMRNQTIAFGSGFFNSSSSNCTGSVDFSELWSLNGTLNYTDSTVSEVNTNATCWVNTTTFLDPSIGSAPPLAYHVIENTGDIAVNLTASIQLSNGTDAWNAEELFCPGGCNNTNSAAVALFTYNNESNACSPGGEFNTTFLTANSAILNHSICASFNSFDQADTINVFVMMRVPKDVTSGAKSFTITYAAITQGGGPP